MKQAVAAMTAEARAAGSAAIVAALRDLDLPRPVLAYVALPDEPDLSAWLGELAGEGALALPRVDGDHLVLHRVDDLGALRVGAFGIREPHAAMPVVERVGSVVVPGRAFDASGGRLGRGKGFYDRLLAGFDGPTVGVAFACQHVEAVPREPWDVPLTRVLWA